MKRQNLLKDIGSALFFFVLSVALWIYIIPAGVPLRASYGGATGVDSRTFPYFAAAMIGLASLAMLTLSVYHCMKLRRGNQETGDEPINNIKRAHHSIAVFTLFVLCSVLLDQAGFIAATTIVPPLILWAVGSRKPLHYISAYVFAVIMYVVFRILLQVRLP